MTAIPFLSDGLVSPCQAACAEMDPEDQQRRPAGTAERCRTRRVCDGPAGAVCSSSCCSSQTQTLNSNGKKHGCPPTTAVFISWQCSGLICLDVYCSSAERKHSFGRREGLFLSRSELRSMEELETSLMSLATRILPPTM